MKREDLEREINDGFTISSSRNTMLDLIEASRDSNVLMGGSRNFARIGCDTVQVWVNAMCDRHENTVKLLENVLEELNTLKEK